ncbi:hypothetical protein VB796_15725 [Arcicella sp. LKC2W]|uniref:hypothetical protein n=1 Tax=Arcicella sp. LKC2W TaxID=2984198 RepID=UPI002B1F39A0|nr:hypothetical protein [Arcicella sp. LKC2W]MEA5460504.1 hypothetical protein [Arcicella sp. LKC2W]
MIKTIVIPQNNSYNLAIPSNYIGKKIEILFYSLDEVMEEKVVTPKKTMADLWGRISIETGDELNKEVEEGRKSWEERLNKQF